MPIEKGNVVELDFELRDADGELIESSKDGDGAPLRYVHGTGELPERVEEALLGLDAGQEIVVDCEAGEAFGPYDPEGLVTVPRTDLPEDAEVVPGDWLNVGVQDEDEGEDEEELEARVVEVSPEGIVIDLNHPLAQEAVQFRMKVLAVDVEE